MRGWGAGGELFWKEFQDPTQGQPAETPSISLVDSSVLSDGLFVP